MYKETMTEDRGPALRASLLRTLNRKQATADDLRARGRRSSSTKERGELLQRAEVLTAEIREGRSALDRIETEALA